VVHRQAQRVQQLHAGASWRGQLSQDSRFRRRFGERLVRTGWRYLRTGSSVAKTTGELINQRRFRAAPVIHQRRLLGARVACRLLARNTIPRKGIQTA
jgi:hypothetical protein